MYIYIYIYIYIDLMNCLLNATPEAAHRGIRYVVIIVILVCIYIYIYIHKHYDHL